MEPQVLSTFPPLLQYGALGLCALMLAAFTWCVLRFIKISEKAIDVIPPLTISVASLEDKVETGNDISAKIKDRLLQFKCPFACAQPAQPVTPVT